MNERIREFARISHLDVYGLGKDREKWEAVLTEFSQLITKGVFDEMARQMFLHCDTQASDPGYQKAMANTLKMYGVDK